MDLIRSNREQALTALQQARDNASLPAQQRMNALLVNDLSKISAGRCRPEATLEEYTPGRGDSEAGAYAVQFVHSGRLYRFPPEDYGDWYDLDAVVAAIHRALADDGVPERFVQLETGGQVAMVVFGKPEAVGAACQKPGLTLGPDLDRPREEGLAFEDEVRRSLGSDDLTKAVRGSRDEQGGAR